MDEYNDLAEEIIENPTMMNEILDKRSNEEIERLYFTLQQMHEDIMGDISDVFKKEDKQKDEQIKHMMAKINYELLDRREYEEGQEKMTQNEKEYVDILVLIEDAERRIEELEEERENTDDERIEEIDDLIQFEKDEIERLEEEAKTLKYRVDMEKLGTSLTIMTPEEIEEEYVHLREEKESYRVMEEEHGIEASDEALELNNDKIEMIEEYAKSSPEIQELIQAQKEAYAGGEERRKQNERELQEDIEYAEKLRNAPFEELENPSYIDALIDKEVKSIEARDSSFEINEYGEIIRPAKQQTVDELRNMSEEELQRLIEKNNKTIEHNNKTLKKSLVERILDQQKTISKQQEEILKLNSQKKEL